MSFPYHVKGAARIELGRAWGKRSAKARSARRIEPDFYTLHMRALHDARGMILREGAIYCGDGRVVRWLVRRSVIGRVNQVESVANGRVFFRGSARNISRRLRHPAHDIPQKR